MFLEPPHDARLLLGVYECGLRPWLLQIYGRDVQPWLLRVYERELPPWLLRHARRVLWVVAVLHEAGLADCRARGDVLLEARTVDGGALETFTPVCVGRVGVRSEPADDVAVDLVKEDLCLEGGVP